LHTLSKMTWPESHSALCCECILLTLAGNSPTKEKNWFYWCFILSLVHFCTCKLEVSNASIFIFLIQRFQHLGRDLGIICHLVLHMKTAQSPYIYRQIGKRKQVSLFFTPVSFWGPLWP
jgi:hypothetical protein